MRRGKLIGLGVGPGDPELMTVRGVRALEQVPAIAFIAAAGRASRARHIAAAYVRPGTRELIAVMPMTQDQDATGRAYTQLVTGIIGELGQGNDVVFLCEGDPLLYGSFANLLGRLANRFEIDVIPGITAMTAAAAVARSPLAAGDEPLAVLPATLPTQRLQASLREADRAVILKVGRHLDRVRQALTQARMSDGAILIENVTTDEQRVRPLASVNESASALFLARSGRAQEPSPMSQGAAILSLGSRTGRLAARLAAALPNAAVHAPADLAGPAEVRFTELGPHLRALFAGGTPIVGLCATGILIRLLAPALRDKHDEPPVLAVAADGSAVVPLLGGHHGAVALARRIAAVLGATPAITTAGDLVLGLALDEPPRGWSLADPQAAKPATARLLDGAGARVMADPGLAVDWPALPPGDELLVRLTVRTDAAADLVYHPRALALGVGCERGAPPETLIDHARTCLARAGLAEAAVACVVSLDLKAAEPAVHALAATLGVPARFFPATRLDEETRRLSTRSDLVHAETGVWGVAEAAALAAVGPEGRLLVMKEIGPRVTCAVAAAARPLDPRTVGRPRGRLALIGLGPGEASWRTQEAERLLAEADELVGYRLYLELAGAAVRTKPQHAFPLGAETERCRFALDLAARGRSVALLCSGDPGIYALASLVLELLEREPTPARERVDLIVSPGLSAMLAAAAQAGAPLGHDFLRDLALRSPHPLGSDRASPPRRRHGRSRHRPLQSRLRAAAGRPRQGPRPSSTASGRGDARDRRPQHRSRRRRAAAHQPGRADARDCRHALAGHHRQHEHPPFRAAARGRLGLYAARLPDRRRAVTVHFIGAGPGAADLITLRGQDLIRRCAVCLYAGSLVPTAIVAQAPEGALVLDTAPLHLDEIMAVIERAHEEGKDVARVHSGDPSLYGAVAEQARRLDARAIPWAITPGVPAYAAAAASLGAELTLPGVAQSVVLTRTAVRASAMPPAETLAAFASTGATLAIHLGITNLARITRELIPVLGADCPVAVVYRASWPDELTLRGTLATIREQVKAAGLTRTALILVGRALEARGFADSRLYAHDHHHVLRPHQARRTTPSTHASASATEPELPSGD